MHEKYGIEKLKSDNGAGMEKEIQHLGVEAQLAHRQADLVDSMLFEMEGVPDLLGSISLSTNMSHGKYGRHTERRHAHIFRGPFAVAHNLQKHKMIQIQSSWSKIYNQSIP